VLSEEIVAEVRRVLAYPRLRRSHPYTDEEMAAFDQYLRQRFPLLADLTHLTGIVRDPNDDMVVATAVKAQAAYIVSRDDDLLALGTYEGITVMTPEAFMGLLREQGLVESLEEGRTRCISARYRERANLAIQSSLSVTEITPRFVLFVRSEGTTEEEIASYISTISSETCNARPARKGNSDGHSH
jgi:putative PIN family toxin of toxin-antitoxin system